MNSKQLNEIVCWQRALTEAGDSHNAILLREAVASIRQANIIICQVVPILEHEAKSPTPSVIGIRNAIEILRRRIPE